MTNQKPRKWCKHIKFTHRPATVIDGLPIAEYFNWDYITDEAPCGVSANNWKVCPICLTKRPK